MLLTKVLFSNVMFRDIVNIIVSHHSFRSERMVLTRSSSKICCIWTPWGYLAQKLAFNWEVSDSDGGCLGVSLCLIVGRGNISALKHALLIFLLQILRATNELVIEAAIESRSLIYQTVRRFLFLSRTPSLKRLVLMFRTRIIDKQL